MKKTSGRVSGGVINLYLHALVNKHPLKQKPYKKEVLGKHIRGFHIEACYKQFAGSFNNYEEQDATWKRVATLAPRM